MIPRCHRSSSGRISPSDARAMPHCSASRALTSPPSCIRLTTPWFGGSSGPGGRRKTLSDGDIRLGNGRCQRCIKRCCDISAIILYLIPRFLVAAVLGTETEVGGGTKIRAGNSAAMKASETNADKQCQRQDPNAPFPSTQSSHMAAGRNVLPQLRRFLHLMPGLAAEGSALRAGHARDAAEDRAIGHLPR